MEHSEFFFLRVRFFQPFSERHPINPFHHDAQSQFVHLLDAHHIDDVWILQWCHNIKLFAEHRHKGFGVSHLFLQTFEHPPATIAARSGDDIVSSCRNGAEVGENATAFHHLLFHKFRSWDAVLHNYCEYGAWAV